VIALMNHIHAHEARLAIGLEPAALADGHLHRLDGLHRTAAAPLGSHMKQVIRDDRWKGRPGVQNVGHGRGAGSMEPCRRGL